MELGLLISTQYALAALMSLVAIWISYKSLKLLNSLGKIGLKIQSVFTPPKKTYKIIERAAGVGGEGQPPLSAIELAQFAEAGWRLHTALYFGNGDLHYILEKDQTDD